MLIVADAAEQLDDLRRALRAVVIEVASATTPEALQTACARPHDLVIVDAQPAHLRATLQIIRASPGHAYLPLLVATNRLGNDPTLAGLLPSYRAMPCTPAEIVTLARRRLAALPAPAKPYSELF